jgi:hypothetical protein
MSDVIIRDKAAYHTRTIDEMERHTGANNSVH